MYFGDYVVTVEKEIQFSLKFHENSMGVRNSYEKWLQKEQLYSDSEVNTDFSAQNEKEILNNLKLTGHIER